VEEGVRKVVTEESRRVGREGGRGMRRRNNEERREKISNLNTSTAGLPRMNCDANVSGLPSSS
jgi:hypothetical protein